MPANTLPIFTITPNLAADGGTSMGAVIAAAANDMTGAGANNVLVFTAGANASYVRRLHFKAVGTNIQTVARIFLNNGTTNLVAANNRLYDDMQLPATTLSANSPTGPGVDYIMEFQIEPGWKIYVGLATAVAAGWVVTPIAGDY
jgi:hypothetical protein